MINFNYQSIHNDRWTLLNYRGEEELKSPDLWHTIDLINCVVGMLHKLEIVEWNAWNDGFQFEQSYEMFLARYVLACSTIYNCDNRVSCYGTWDNELMIVPNNYIRFVDQLTELNPHLHYHDFWWQVIHDYIDAHNKWWSKNN